MITNELNKLVKSLLKNITREYYISYLLKLYYLIVNNQVYTTINNQSLKILKQETQVLSFLNKCFKNTNNDLKTLLDLTYLISDIDDIRTSYIKENSNMGREKASTYQLDLINEKTIEAQKLQKSLN
jgi:hypothetical protein